MGEYFKTATVSELLADEGKFAPIFVPADEYLCSSEGQNLSDREWDAYCNARVLAHCWLLPLSVIEKYNFRAFVTNEGYDQDLTIYSNDLTIDGVEYKLYIFYIIYTLNVIIIDINMYYIYCVYIIYIL